MLVVLKKEKSANVFLNRVITLKSSLIRVMKPGKKHLPIYAAREGVTYAFDYGQTIIFQDNFKYLGDIPFSVYFDFETTTTDGSVFFYPKMEIYDLNHFKEEHVPFFNKTTFDQLKDVASGVLAGEKAMSLAELFSEELKFTVDTFNDLVFKHYKFFEIDDIKKQIFRKENPINKQSTICSICGFPLDIENVG